MKKPALILIARWPAIGRCKSRLAVSIGYEQAAVIQQKLTEHTIHVARAIEKEGIADVYIAVSGLALKAAKRWGQQHKIQNILLQGNGSLGLILRRQVMNVQKNNDSKFDNGRTTVLIGTDLPMLCFRDLVESFDLLKAHEIVLGPSKDGGYWLLGLTGKLVCPVAQWPFTGIHWGSSQVSDETISRAKHYGADLSLLQEKNDLDHLGDIDPWLK